MCVSTSLTWVVHISTMIFRYFASQIDPEVIPVFAHMLANIESFLYTYVVDKQIESINNLKIECGILFKIFFIRSSFCYFCLKKTFTKLRGVYTR